MPDCNLYNLRAAYFEIAHGKITDMNPAGEKLLQTGLDAGIKNIKKYIKELPMNLKMHGKSYQK